MGPSLREGGGEGRGDEWEKRVGEREGIEKGELVHVCLFRHFMGYFSGHLALGVRR